MPSISLQRWCTSIFPTSVRWHGEWFTTAHVKLGRSKRDREFSAGRRCASRALTALTDCCKGGAPETIQIAASPDRSPKWPAGIVGSITHSDWSVWAAVAPDQTLCGIGIDMELIDGTTAHRVRDSIASEDEWSLASSLGLAFPTTFALVFSAKESFYKCWFPIIRNYFVFSQAFVAAIDSESITIQFGSANPNVDRAPASLDVCYCVCAGEVYTATWIPAAGELA